MIYLRSAAFVVLQAAATVVFAVLAWLTFPFGPFTRYRVITLWNRSVLWLAQAMCGIRYEIRGGENLPQAPAVVLAKHQSAWETIALPVLFPPLAIVAKRELLRVPFFGWGLAMLSPIAIDRKAGREAIKQILRQGAARLQAGFGVLVFPEGTRMKPGEAGRYGIGGAWLAAHTGAEVVPVAHNAGELWGKNAFVKYPGTITVSIGPPIATHGLKPDAVNEVARAWIEAEMERLPHARA